MTRLKKKAQTWHIKGGLGLAALAVAALFVSGSFGGVSPLGLTSTGSTGTGASALSSSHAGMSFHDRTATASAHSTATSSRTSASHAQFIVTFAQGTSSSDQASEIAAAGATDVSAIAPLSMHTINVPAGSKQAVISALRADPNVATVERNDNRKTEGTPSDPGYVDQWNLPMVGWDQIYGSANPLGSSTIAVLDTGVSGSTGDLNLGAGWSAFGTDPTNDPNGHGTAVASIAAATTGNGGIAGVDFSPVTILPVQVLDSNGLGQDSDIVQGIVWAADNGANVILMSFSNPGYSQALQDAISYAWGKGAVVVAATGNGGVSTPTYPAGDADVMGVAGTDQSDQPWASSNTGADTFLAAPATSIPADATDGSETSITGTSASAAMVAGAAALLLANDPLATNSIVDGRLARSADPVGTADQTGNGRLNVARAFADTGTDPVTPLGAPGGGPIVGPYVIANKNLVINFAGTGGGTVSITDTTTPTDNQSCPSTTNPCTDSLVNNDVGTLAATPNATSTFAGWTLATWTGSPTPCTGTNSPCNFSMGNNAQSVTATFNITTPTVTGTSPTSPGNSTTPKIIGTAPTGSTVKLYTNSTCTNAVAGGSGTAAAFASPGLPVTVTANTSTTFWATATIGANTSACSSSSVTYVEDSIAPTVSSFTCAPSPGLTNATSVSCSVSFSEPVTGFSSSGVTIGGTSSSWSAGTVTGSGSGPYTFTVSRGSPNSDGTLTLQIKAGAATDLAGNSSTASSTLNYTIDTTPPTASLSCLPSASPSNSTSFNCSVTFSESVSGFSSTTGDVTIGGTSSNWTKGASSGSGAGPYTFTVSRGSPNTDGTLTIQVAAGAAQDTATNNNTASNTVSYTIDTTAPTAALSCLPSASPSNSTSFNCSVTFSESVSGFSSTTSDVTIGGTSSNWTKGASSGSGAGPYTFTVSRGSPNSDGTLTIQVAAGAAQDTATNNNTASNTVSYTIDTIAPSVSVSFPANNGNYNTAGWNGGAPIAGTATDGGSGIAGAGSIQLTITQVSSGKTWNGTSFASGTNTVSASTYDGSSAWTYTFPASNFPADGSYTVSASATDRANNTGTSSTNSFKYDTTNPFVAVVFPGNNGSYNTAGWNGSAPISGFAVDNAGSGIAGASSIKLTITQVSTGFTWNGSSFASGSNTVSASTYDGSSGWTYTFPASNFPADGSYTVSAAATDRANNTGTSSSNSFKYDTTNPTVSVSFPANNGNYNTAGWNSGAPIAGTATDAGSGIAAIGLTITQVSTGKTWNGTSFASGSNTVNSTTYDGTSAWTYTFPASNFPADGSYTVQVSAFDQAGNTVSSSSKSFKYDTVNPTITATHTATGSNGWNTNSPVTVNVTTSDATSGLAGAPTCTVDGSPATVSGTGPYAVSVSGQGTHPVSCSVSDNAGNSNSASDSVKIDTVAPSTTLATSPASPDGTNNWFQQSSVSFTLSASDATSGVANSFYTIDGGGTLTYSGPVTINTQGDHTVTYWSTDNAGNVESANTTHIKLDNVNPSISVSHSADGSNGWNVAQPVTVNVTTSDATSGVAGAPTCTVDGSPATVSGTGPYTVSVSGQGTHPVSCSVSDNAGNSNSASDTVKIDTVAPSTSLSIAPSSPDGSNGWYSSTPLVTLTASDATSGVAATTYEINGGATHTYTGPFALPDGMDTVTYRSTDTADNLESDHTSSTFEVDTVNPSTTLSIAPSSPDGSNGWYSSTPLVTLTASDATSGVAATTYEINGGATHSYTGPFSLPDGLDTVTYRSTDTAGNTEGDNTSSTFKVDTVNPSISVSHTPDGSNGWNVTQPVVVQVAVSDATSGIAAAPSCSVDGGPAAPASGSSSPYTVDVSGQGSHTVDCSVSDNAGNSNSDTDSAINIDTVAPSTTLATSPASPDGTNGWFQQSSVSFTLGATDATSGVANTFYTIDGGSPLVYSSAVTISTQGDHTVTYWSVDSAGNVESAHTAHIKLDNVAPQSTDNAPAGWQNTPVTVHLSATDATSGVASVTYSVDGGSPVTVSSNATDVTIAAPADHSNDGIHSISYFATDNAGNAESAHTATVKIDTLNPVSTDNAPSGWQNTATTVHLSATDAPAGNAFSPDSSGVASITYSVDGGSPVTVTSDNTDVTIAAPSDHSNDGIHSISYFATDNAGNAESAHTATVKIDTQNPNSQISFPTNNSDLNTSTYTAGCSTPGVEDICGTASDPAASSTFGSNSSGLATVEVSIKQDSSGLYWNGSSFSASSETWNLAGGTASWSYNLASPPEGTYTIHSRATDVAGNVESSFDTATFNEVHVNVDNTAPSSSVSFPAAGADLTTANYSNGCADSTPDVCGSATDPATSPQVASGVAKVEVSIQRTSDNEYWNGSSWQTGQTWNLASGTTSWSYGFTPAPDDTYTVVSKATDNATNAETPGAGHSFTIDDQAPTSTDNAQAAWQNTATTVHLSATDPGSFPSGVASITYSVDGGTPVTVSSNATDVTIAAPADHSNDGIHSISYFATDNAGNAESAHTATVKIDTLNPVSTDNAPSGWQNTATTVHLSATDAPAGNAFSPDSSGVASITYTVDGNTPVTVSSNATDVTIAAPADHSNDGLHTIEYWATDNANNVESPHNSTTVKIDTQNPASTDTNDGAWHNADYTVTLNATDAPAGNAFSADSSGVKNIKYSVDGGATQTINNNTTDVTIPAPADHSNDGLHTIEYWATDNANNVESPHNSTTVKIDTQNPASTDTNDGAWHNADYTVTLNATDAPAGNAFSADSSGVKNIKYSVDGGATQTINNNTTDVTIPAPADHSNDGLHTIEYWATDNANNVESPHNSTTVKIDTQNPASTDTNDGAWHNADYTVTLNATDAPAGNAFSADSSGVKNIKYSVDGGATQTINNNTTDVTIPAPADHSNDGLHTIEYWATDNANNVESPHNSTTVKIDTGTPNSQITFPANNSDYNSSTYSAGCGTVTGDICGTSSDPLAGPAASDSGVTKVEVSIKQDATGMYWNGSGFTAASEAFNSASTSDGWADWSYNLASPPEGTYTIHSRATDVAGNVESSFDTATFNEVHVNVDNTAPSSSVSFPAAGADLTTANYSNGCADSTPDVCGSATDPATSPQVASGVAKVEVSIQRTSDNEYWNGSSWQTGQTWNLASGTTSWSYGFTPAPDDTYTVVSKATDNATNAETPGAGHSFTIDDQAPTSTDNAQAAWQNTATTVHLSATDPGSFPSGVASITYSVDGGTPVTVSSNATDVTIAAPADHSNDGIHSISYFATDNAGNAESAHTATVKIDTLNPVSTDNAPSGWQNTATTVHLSATDAPAGNAFSPDSSGVASITYTVDGNTPVTVSSNATDVTIAAPADHSNDGLHTIEYWATDNANNVESPHNSTTVKIDTQNPASTDNAPAAWQNTPVTVHLSATDAPAGNAFSPDSSGVASVTYSVDGGSPVTVSSNATDVTIAAPADHSNDGIHSISYFATDNAGNAESAHTATVKIDTLNPVSTDNAPSGWQNTATTVHLSATDAPAGNAFSPDSSGVASITYSVDGGSPVTVTSDNTDVTIAAPSDHSNDGIHSISYFATDNAGNAESAHTATVKIDTQNPNSQISFPTNNSDLNTSTYTAGCSTPGVEDICGTASDPAASSTFGSNSSGLATVEVSIKQDSSGLYWNGSSFSASSETWNLAGGTASWSYNLASPPEGTYTIHSRATDVAGNVESSFDTATFNEVHVNVDNTAPSSSVSFPAAGADLTTANYSNGCADSTPDVCGSATDPATSPQVASGVAKVEVSIQRTSDNEYWNGSSWQTGQTWNLASGTTSWSYGFTPAPDDTYTVVSKATDNATNAETPGAGHSFTIDDQAPTSSASVPDYETSPSFNVNYTAGDGGSDPSGLAKVELYVDTPAAGGYSLAATDSAPTTSGSFNYHATDGDGTYSFYTVATDKAGNVEAKSTADDSTILDTVNPSISVSHTADGSNGWNVTQPVVVHVAVSDATSGIAAAPSCSIDGGSPITADGSSSPYTVDVSGQGSHTVDCTVSDNAGNSNSASDHTIEIDTVNPSISVTHTTDGSNDWNVTQPVHVQVAVSDATSGIAATPSCSVDGSPAAPASGSSSPYTVDVSGQGSHTVSCSVSDNAGNSNSDSDSTIKIDTVKPSTTLSIAPPSPNGSNGWYKSSAPTVTLTPTDATSGVATTTYEIDGGSTHTYTGPFTLPDGMDTVTYRSSDNAGNAEADNTSSTFEVDTVKPSTSLAIAPSSPNGSNGWYKSSAPTVTLTPTDATSGVATTTYEIDGGSTHTYTGPFTLPDGMDTVTYRSSDNAGNAEADNTSSTFKVDTVNPSISVSHTADGNASWNVHSPVTVNITASDATSGLNGDPVCTDNGNPLSVSPAAPGAWTASVSGDGIHNVNCSISDNAGNSNSNNDTVKTDTGQPNTTIAFPVNNTTYSASQWAAGCTNPGSICGTSSDPLVSPATADSGVAKVEVSILQNSSSMYWDGTGFTSATPVWSLATGTGNWHYAFTPTTDGQYTVDSRGTDAAGNVETSIDVAHMNEVGFTSDTTGPVTSGTAAAPSPTNAPPTVTATVTDALSNVVAAEYFIDSSSCTNGSGTAMNASDGSFNSSTEGVTATLSASNFNALSQGAHTVYVHGEDSHGNWGACDSATFVKDTTIAVAVTSAASVNSSNASTGGAASGTTDDNANTVKVTVSDAGNAHTVGPFTASVSSGTWSVSGLNLSSLNDGTITYKATATDAAGNTANATKTATKDTTIAVAVTSAASVNSSNASTGGAASGTTDDNANTVKVTVSDAGNAHTVGPFTASVSSGTWSVSGLNLSSLNDGTITYKATATDAAGNTANDTKTATKDTVTNVAITSWTHPVNASNKANVSASGSAEAGDTVSLTISDGTNSVGPFTTTATGGSWSFSGKDVSSLNDGTITYSVTATDGVGNTANDSKTATKDTVAPTVTINQASGQSDPTSTSPIHFTAVFSEPVSPFTGSSVSFAGSTAGGTLSASVTDSGDHKTFDVAVSGMTTGGTVVASIPAGGASDLAGNPSTASTSTDHTVTWIPLSAVNDSADVNANSTNYQIDVLANDTVPSGGSISSIQKSGNTPVPGTTTNVTTDQGGKASVVACGTCNAGQAISYSPATDYVGPDGFDYTITDGHGNYSTAHVSINVVATGSLDSQMILEDSNLNDQHGEFDVLFGKSPKPYDSTAVRLQNTDPGNLHLHTDIYNHTNVNTAGCTGPPNNNSCTIDSANGNRVVTILTIPDMPANCGGANVRPYTNLSVNTNLDPNCSNPGGEGQPAFALQGGPDGKDAVHAHPGNGPGGPPGPGPGPDKNVLVQYLNYAQYTANGNSCADNGSTPWSTTLPAGGLAKCIKISGLAIKVNDDADIDVSVQFRPTGTDWPASANPAQFFHAGFSFKLNKAITFDTGTPAAKTYTAIDNIDTVAVGKKVTAVGGFVFTGATATNIGGAPAIGDSVRLFNLPSDALTSPSAPWGSCSASPVAYTTTDNGGFYFIQSTGYNDPNASSPPQNLPANQQYFVQVCNGTTPVVGGLIDHKLGNGEFEEWDVNANPAVPRPMTLAIKHQNGKPDNNDTVEVDWTEPLAEVTMCSTWGWDNTKDQTLNTVTLRIADNAGTTGDDVLQVTSASACGGAFHFGTVDLGSPNYVTANTDFTNSKITWNHNGTLMFTLGGGPSTTLAVTTPVTAVYTPDPLMMDTSGNGATGTASDPSTGGNMSNF